MDPQVDEEACPWPCNNILVMLIQIDAAAKPLRFDGAEVYGRRWDNVGRGRRGRALFSSIGDDAKQ
jgi:hypothetical protein